MGSRLHHRNARPLWPGSCNRHPPGLQKSPSEGHWRHLLQLLWSVRNRTEADLRLLISQMIRMGYIIQTEGEYSVLKAGNIEDLQNKNTKIIIKKFKEKEKISTTKKHKTSFKKDSFSASAESSSADSTATNSSRNSALLKPCGSSVSRLPRKNLSLPTSSSPTEPLSICAVNFLRMRMKCSMYPV